MLASITSHDNDTWRPTQRCSDATALTQEQNGRHRWLPMMTTRRDLQYVEPRQQPQQKDKKFTEMKKLHSPLVRKEDINECQDWKNSSLKNIRQRFNYHIQCEDELEPNETHDYVDENTCNFQCTALQTAKVDDRTPTAAAIPRISKKKFRQVREATHAHGTLSVGVCRTVDVQSNGKFSCNA